MKTFNQFVNESNTNFVISFENKSIEHYNFLNKFFTMTFDLQQFLNNDKIYIVVAKENNKLIGVSLFRMDNNKIHMNYTVVDPTYRNKGINKKIKQFIINFAKNNNVILITANVRKSNDYSIKSFLSCGFLINDKAISKYPDGEEKIPLYLKIQ